jgi:hypothetical protein
MVLMKGKKEMKKAFVAVILALMVLGAACSSSNDTKKPKVVVDDTTTTTTGSVITPTTGSGSVSSDTVDPTVYSQCATDGESLGNEWNSLSTALNEVASSNPSQSVINAAVAAVRRGITKTRAWISTCGTYFPGVKARVEPLMDEMETVVNGMENSN